MAGGDTPENWRAQTELGTQEFYGQTEMVPAPRGYHELVNLVGFKMLFDNKNMSRHLSSAYSVDVD